MTGRRLLRALVLTTIVLAGCAAYARWIEPQWIVVEEVDVTIAGLSPSLDGTTIAFIADLQVVEPGGRERRLVEKLDRIQPDLVLVGGDFANVPYYMTDYVIRAALACSVVSTFPSRYGTICVWGNNDLPEGIVEPAARRGLRVLTNEWQHVDLDGDSLVIVGLDDPVTDRADWNTAFAEEPPKPYILLVHSPDAFPEAARRGAALVLAGHTHGGQVLSPLLWLIPRRLLRLKPETPVYRAGLYESGGSVLYVTRGVGTSYTPMRFLCPPELTLITLRSSPT